MKDTLEQRSFSTFPALLREIPDPPNTLYLRGTYPCEDMKFLAVVGSRKYTPYGKSACEALIEGLRGYPICIISGLALGIDAIAHESALKAGLTTIAVPGSGLHDSVLYPRTNFALAQRILKEGGALLSEFPPDHPARPENFPQRNRIMAGLSHAVLVVEADLRSGTLITARLAMEYNREVLVVPGSIFSSQSLGNHHLLRTGATPIGSAEHILEALGFETKPQNTGPYLIPDNCTEPERMILLLLEIPKEREVILSELTLPTAEINSLLSLLEIKGLIQERGGFIVRT